MAVYVKNIIISLRRALSVAVLLLMFLSAMTVHAVPLLLNFQGRVTVDGTVFSGTGQFKFALVNADGSQSYWSNDDSSSAGAEPTAAIAITVTNGNYALHLGDASLANMGSLQASVFENDPIYLRVWFSDDTNGFEQLGADHRITSVAFALQAKSAEVAETVTALPADFVTEGNLVQDLRNKLATLQAAVTSLETQINGLSTTGQAGAVVASSSASDSTLGSQGYVKFLTIAGDSWSASPGDGTPSDRLGHGAAWAGTGMAIWGGGLGSGTYLGTGGIYNPATDTWTSITPLDAPASRSDHSVVWSGTELIVWGGYGSVGILNSGGRYQPSTDSWLPLAATGAPSARFAGAAVWTGSRMVVWGGRNNTGILNDGALYDPVADSWTALDLNGAPFARYGAVAALADDAVLLWGGEGASGSLADGARLALSSGVPTTWSAISVTGAPSARSGHAAVWTGSKLIVWGGIQGGSHQATGGIYDPGTDSWATITTTEAPSAREKHAAVWTGSEMVVIGGEGLSGSLADSHAYNPTSDSWRSLSGSTGARNRSTAVWSGSQVLIFGGDADGQTVGQPMEIDPTPPVHLYRKQ